MKTLSIKIIALFILVAGAFPVFAWQKNYSFDNFLPNKGADWTHCSSSFTSSSVILDVVNVSGSDGCILGFGSNFVVGHATQLYPPWVLNFSVISNSDCKLRLVTNTTNSAFTSLSPTFLYLSDYSIGVASTTSWSFASGGPSSIQGGGLLIFSNSGGTANCKIELFSIVNSYGDVIFDPVLSLNQQSGSGGGSVTLPDPFVVHGVNDDLQNFALILVIFAIVVMLVVYLFKPFTHYGRE